MISCGKTSDHLVNKGPALLNILLAGDWRWRWWKPSHLPYHEHPMGIEWQRHTHEGRTNSFQHWYKEWQPHQFCSFIIQPNLPQTLNTWSIGLVVHLYPLCWRLSHAPWRTPSQQLLTHCHHHISSPGSSFSILKKVSSHGELKLESRVGEAAIQRHSPAQNAWQSG